MGRAARAGAAVGRAARMCGAVALDALRRRGGRGHRLSLDDDRGWRARRWGGRVTTGCPAKLHVRLACCCRLVLPLARARGGGHARR